MKNKFAFLMDLFLIWNFVACFVFTMSFHSVDLAYNFKGSTDCNSFNCVSMDQRYCWGIDGMIAGFMMFMAEVIYFTAYVFPIILNNQKEVQTQWNHQQKQQESVQKNKPVSNLELAKSLIQT